MAAVVADVTVNKKTGKITVTNLYGAQDTGLIVYPGGVENQAVGSMTQGPSRALFEQVIFNKTNVTSLDWVTYPILRFKDAPKITFSLVQRTDIPAVATGTPRALAARDRLRRAADRSDRGCDRERVLRRDGRSCPPGADQPGPRQGSPQGRRRRLIAPGRET